MKINVISNKNLNKSKIFVEESQELIAEADIDGGKWYSILFK